MTENGQPPATAATTAPATTPATTAPATTAPATTAPATTAPATPTPAPTEKTARGSIKGVAPRRFSNAFTIPAARPVMRYMPTYRLEPKYPLNKEVCEKIIKNVMDKTFDAFTYTAKNALNTCGLVSEEIKNRIKNQNYDRYRYICVVTIGEKCMQGLKSVVNFLWDPTKDGYISYVYDKPDFFAVATFYYLYYD